MSRPGGIFKNDAAARAAWGDAYKAIPKSVFALAAWHLANLCSDEPDVGGQAEKRMIEELTALRDGGHLSAEQADRAIKAIVKAVQL